MYGAAVLPVLAVASSLLGGGKGGGTQSYTPQEQELAVQNPTPETPEPTLGVDNSDNASGTAKKGKSALVIQRNPSVGLAGSTTGTGVSVPKG